MRMVTIYFVGLLLLASSMSAEAIPVDLYFTGQVTALSGTYIQPGVGASNIDINIGPYFSGYISYDTDIAHAAMLNTTFSSGQVSTGNSYLSVVQNNGITDIIAQMHWLDSITNTQLCDPVVYFTFNSNTGNGSLKYEFTDLASGSLEGEICQFSNSPNQPVPEPSTMLFLAAGLAGVFIFGRKQLFQKQG